MSFVPGIGAVRTCAFHRSHRSNDKGDRLLPIRLYLGARVLRGLLAPHGEKL
jgi:hypothetical protein